MIKRLIIILFTITLFSIPAAAEEAGQDEFYSDQFKISGADEINDALPDDTRKYLEENNLDPSDYSWVNTLSPGNVFSHIWNFIVTGATTPLRTATGILGIILITAALNAFGEKSSAMTAASYASVTATAAIIAAPIFSVISASVNAMKGSGVFMLSFIPIFATVVAASGAVITSVSMSALLLAATQVVSYISNFVVVPLMGGQLAISISSSVSPLIENSGIAAGIKKLSFWIMSFLTTVFIGILSIQTAVNASADSLSIKTAKFIIGSSVPVAGTAISEALTTVTASMGLLKSSVGIYGVVACCIIFLPLVIELILWRIALMITSCISDLFALPKISSLLKAVDTMMSILIGIILLTGVMFVISLTLVVTTGKT